MKIVENIQIVKNEKGEFWHNICGESNWKNDEASPNLQRIIIDLYRIANKRSLSQADKDNAAHRLLADYKKALLNNISTDTDSIDDMTKHLTLENLINFFTEFEFEPNLRFTNTLSRIARISIDKANTYVINYFKLSDKQCIADLTEKLKSREWSDIITVLSKCSIHKIINNRLKIYFGSQGTGKTTKAIEESSNNVMVCHSAMLPSDLMEDFTFIDGKSTFTKSALRKAIDEGKTITLDEINLLPFESLRFLQSIVDGKSEFVYKGETIKITEGFQIIGTMNLIVNNAVFSLPEPLVDRCSDIQEYKLNADNLSLAF